MPHYHKLGNIPHKRHTQFRKPDGSLYAEQLFSTEGFSNDYSLLYHTYAPTLIVSCEEPINVAPKIAEEKLADYCDVFCEQNYFTKEETIEILTAGKKFGMTPKVHAEQLSNTGGVLAGIEVGAISVDHLEFLGEEEINLLKNSNTMPTLLPGAQFFLGLPFPPARQMIDAGFG